MQTTMSLQEEPRGKTCVFAEGPRAQTGLRGGKLAAKYARNGYALLEKRRKALIYIRFAAINSRDMPLQAAISRCPGITARLTAARLPI